MALAEGNTPTSTAQPPTSPATESDTASVVGCHFRDSVVSFAVDISGSTDGQTLSTEIAFVRGVSKLLSPRSRFACSVLPWDDSTHTARSLAQLDGLSAQGGTDPGVLLRSSDHRRAIGESELWFLMTDGLIPASARNSFAHDIAAHGLHGISCVVVVFGNSAVGPNSCDISVGIGVFAVVPNCAFLFCDTYGAGCSLRVMQTKGTFDVLLQGRPHPVFDSSVRWDQLPPVSIDDLAGVVVPPRQKLRPNEVALQDSLVIDMNDILANRLKPDEVAGIFSNPLSLDSVRMTMQARDQDGAFRHWIEQQAIHTENPLTLPRRDVGGQAAALFAELADIVRRWQTPPPRLQARLRSAYRTNMDRFLFEVRTREGHAADRQEVIRNAAANSRTPIHRSEAMSPSSRRIERGFANRSVPVTKLQPYTSAFTKTTPQCQPSHQPMQPPNAPHAARHRRSAVMSNRWQGGRDRGPTEPAWGNWEDNIQSPSLLGLMYTTGLRSTQGSFKGTCSLCGAKNMTLAWLFRAVPNVTPGFPAPGSRTRLAFPLAMGSFPEARDALVSVMSSPPPGPSAHPKLSGISGPSGQSGLSRLPGLSAGPSLVCDPCSVHCTRNNGSAQSMGINVALPMVRFSENCNAMGKILSEAFENRFSENDVAQVFLSALLLAAEQPLTPESSAASALTWTERDFSTAATSAISTKTFRAAVEWTVSDMVFSTMVLAELSETFLVASTTAAPRQRLSTVLVNLFQELDWSCGSNEHSGFVAPLLRYPLPGFITILKASSFLSASEEPWVADWSEQDGGVRLASRRRAVFRRLLYQICEELDTVATNLSETSDAQPAAQVIRGLLLRSGESFEDAKEPILSVSIQSLRTASLISAANYSTFSRAEEFRYLEDPSTTWVGPATALFLYGVFFVVTTHPRRTVLETFKDVLKLPEVGSTLLRPEETDRENVGRTRSRLI